MRIHRFYIGDIEPELNAILIEDKDLVHQWKNVFRMKAGDEVILFNDNHLEYHARFISLDKKSSSFEILSISDGKIADKEITLCAALIKKDNFEIIIQKSVEIGVTKIIPIISDRSEKKFLNIERAKKIIIEACEQCGRVDIPTLEDPISLEVSFSMISNDTNIISFEPRGSSFDAKIFTAKKIALYIGPEGGWTEEELVSLGKKGVVINIPTFVLRAETAAISALTLARVLS